MKVSGSTTFYPSVIFYVTVYNLSCFFSVKLIVAHYLISQAVYTVLREAEDRSISPIPVWDLPIWKDISPRQRKVTAALKLVNDTLNNLIAICKVIFSLQ